MHFAGGVFSKISRLILTINFFENILLSKMVAITKNISSKLQLLKWTGNEMDHIGYPLHSEI
jgi:hypothetical protein